MQLPAYKKKYINYMSKPFTLMFNSLTSLLDCQISRPTDTGSVCHHTGVRIKFLDGQHIY